MKNKQSLYSMRYDAKNTKRYYLKLNTKKDSELIYQLDRQSNIQGYLKELIKEDIKKEPTPKE